ncbi:hypothetical protein [Sinomonas sp. G460-2]|uniref:hypothetical protein n=1 Tax=Sinomonas sp. G460-2 TaxID=3393464 RepID=UPI0039EE3D5B
MSSIAGQSQLHRTTAASPTQARHEGRVAIYRESGARRALSSLRAAWRRGAELSRAIDEAKDTAWQAPDGPSHRLLG